MLVTYLKSLLAKLQVILLLPYFTFAFIFLLVFVIFPFYLYRSVIDLIARGSDIKVSRILTGLSVSLLRDHDVQYEKPLSTIVVCLKLRGNMTLPSLRELFRTRVILKRDPQDKQYLQFPELQQYYQLYKGYVFLKWDREFDLDDHIKLYESRRTPVRRQELLKISEELTVKPFKEGKSPWELFLLDNGPIKDDNQVRDYYMFLRIHHGIADGFSVQRILTSLDPDYVVDGKTENCTIPRKIFTFCWTALWGPYELLKKLLIDKEPYHSLHLPKRKLAKEYFICESELFQKEDVRRLKKYFGVGFTAVLVSVVSGAIQRFLKRRNGTVPLPERQVLGIPFATKASSLQGRLKNDFLIASLDIPVHIRNPLNRTQNIHAQLQQLQRSTLPQFLGFVVDCLSCLPVNMMRALTKKSLFSTAYSTIPGPMGQIKYLGGVLEEVTFTYGTGASSCGLGFSSITYLDTFRFMLFVDKKLVIDRKAADEIVQCVKEEFDYLCEFESGFNQ